MSSYDLLIDAERHDDVLIFIQRYLQLVQKQGDLVLPECYDTDAMTDSWSEIVSLVVGEFSDKFLTAIVRKWKRLLRKLPKNLEGDELLRCVILESYSLAPSFTKGGIQVTLSSSEDTD